jgi:hypothetical protein
MKGSMAKGKAYGGIFLATKGEPLDILAGLRGSTSLDLPSSVVNLQVLKMMDIETYVCKFSVSEAAKA